MQDHLHISDHPHESHLGTDSQIAQTPALHVRNFVKMEKKMRILELHSNGKC